MNRSFPTATAPAHGLRRRRAALPAAVAALGVLAAAGCSSGAGARFSPPAAGPQAPFAPQAVPGGSDDGYGWLHRSLGTADERTQALYDRGLALAAGYDWLLASRAFRAALNREPELALLHLAFADVSRELGDEAAVRRHREAARGATGGAGEREQAWGLLALQREDAIAAPEAARAAAHAAYREAIDDYLARWPDDADALVLRGDSESSHLAGHGRSGGEAALPWYRAALVRVPEHLAANHYLAHALENTDRLAEAAGYARRFAELAPASPHAQHMAGHPLPRLGRWREARGWFERADRLHRERFAAGVLTAESDWHFGHNLRMLGFVLWRLGDEEGAERRFREAFDRETTGTEAGADCAPWLELLLLRGRYEELATAAKECIQRPAASAQAVGWALHGEALVGLGREAEARRSLGRAIEILTQLWQAAQASNAPSGYGRLGAVMRSTRALRGKLAMLAGGSSDADRWLLQVAEVGVAGHDLDSWAPGLLRLYELTAFARRSGHPWLETALTERIDALPPVEPEAVR